MIPLLAQAQTQVPAPTTAPDGDLRPLRGVVEIPEPDPVWPYYAVPAALVLVAVIVYLYFRRRNREAVRRSASEVALDELYAARDLMSEGDSRTYAIAVSDVLRRYLDNRFGLRAPRQTTEELLAAVAADPGSPLGGQRELLSDFLGHCDLGKFGGWTLDLPQMDALHASAARVIDETAPAPTPSA